MTVADCERVQTRWFETRASALGGDVWRDEGLLWTDGPDGFNLMFPRTMTLAAVRRGVERARDLGRGIVGAWLGADVDPRCLAEAGFDEGWSPWWMTADLGDVPIVTDPRVRLHEDSSDDLGELAAQHSLVTLTSLRPPRVWCAVARTADRELAGYAWSIRDDDLAGVFDMEVWPRFQRQGLGTALLSTVCAAARRSGAGAAVLNATPEGKQLYSTCGFTQIGEGITWWNHLGPT